MTSYFVPSGTIEAGTTQQQVTSEAGGRHKREGGSQEEREASAHEQILQKKVQDITSSTGAGGQAYTKFFCGFHCIIEVRKQLLHKMLSQDNTI